MKRITRRQLSLSAMGLAALGLSGCMSDDEEQPSDDGDGESPPEDGDDGGDDGDDGDPSNSSELEDPDEATIDRTTIDWGEAIDDWENWYGSGGSYVGAVETGALTNGSALEVELLSTRFATAGYDFEEPFELGTGNVSTAVKVEEPSNAQLEIRFRAPNSENRWTCTRHLPEQTNDWMRVDLGITRGQGSPDPEDVQSLRVHVAGQSEGEVKYWLDDLRITESEGESTAILVFYGGHQSHYDTAFSILEDYDFPAAIAVNPRGIGSGDRLGLDELREMRDAGWDVCSFPTRRGALTELEPDEQQTVIQDAQDRLRELGFEDGARHFFAPQQRINGDVIDVVREHHDTGFVYGACSTGIPPTNPHAIPVLWGDDYDSSRSVVLRADIHEQLAVLGFSGVGDEDTDVDEFERQLDRIEDNDYGDGFEVVTPTQFADTYL